MPGLNQTGPMGQGPMTGRGLGRCNDASWQANANDSNQQDANTSTNSRAYGYGAFGFGRGFGRGRGCRGMGRQARFGGRR